MTMSEVLIEKYAEQRKAHEQFVSLFNTIFETAKAMQSIAIKITNNYDNILEQINAIRSPPSVPTQKRRKASSFDTPSTTVREDDYTSKNNSDTGLLGSILNENINLPDSDESFFVLTQSPLTPKKISTETNNSERQKTNKSEIKDDIKKESSQTSKQEKALQCERQRKKTNLSLSRFSTTFKMSPETKTQGEQLPVRPILTTPKLIKSTLDQQENIAPAGKWTSKKGPPVNLRKSASCMVTSPTTNKINNSILNRTRLRQTKLRFPESSNKSTTDEDETYFEEFIVPSPTAFSSTRFLNKKELSVNKDSKKTADCAEDDFDIDQTYFSEAEKSAKQKCATKIKQEVLTPTAKSAILNKDTSIEYSEPSVVLVKTASQENIITIEETQPSKKDLFMQAISEERRKEQESRKSVLNVMGPPKVSLLNKRTVSSTKPPTIEKSHTRRCNDCTKHYEFLRNCGLPVDVILTKLPRNCRECRNVQLHETPPGFWNPEFSPTQMN